MAFSFGNWKKPKGHSPESPEPAAPAAEPQPEQAPEPEAQRGGYQGMVVKPIPIHEPLSAKQQKKISARIHIPPISLRNPDDGSPPPKAKLTSPAPIPPAPMAGKFAPMKAPVPPAPASNIFGASRYAPTPAPAPVEEQPAYAEPAAEAPAEPEAYAEPEPEPLTGFPVLPVIPMSPSLRVPAPSPGAPAPAPTPAPAEPAGPRSSLLRRPALAPPPPAFQPKRTASIAHAPSPAPAAEAAPAPAPEPAPVPSAPASFAPPPASFSPPPLASAPAPSPVTPPSGFMPPRLSPLDTRQTEVAPAAPLAPHLARQASPEVIYNPDTNPYAVAENEPQAEYAYEEEEDGGVAVAEAEEEYPAQEETGDTPEAAADEEYEYATATFQRRSAMLSAIFLNAPPRLPFPPRLGPRIEDSGDRLENGHRPILMLREPVGRVATLPAPAFTPVTFPPPPSPAPAPPPVALPPPPPPRPSLPREERPLNLGSVPLIPLETKRLVVSKGQTPLLPPPPPTLPRPPATPPAFPPAPSGLYSPSDEEVIDYHHAVEEFGLPIAFQTQATLPPPPPPMGLAVPPPPPTGPAMPPPPPPVLFAEAPVEEPAVEFAPADYAEAPQEYAPAPEEVPAYAEPVAEAYAETEAAAPEVEEYLAQAEAATAAAQEQNPAMFQLMGDHTVDARKISAAISRLPGLSHCVIMFNDGLLLAGELPPELNIDALSAIAPQFLQKVNVYSEELAIGSTRLFTIYCDRGIISFFTGRGICVSVIHREAGFQAGVRELLERVTSELAQIYAP